MSFFVREESNFRRAPPLTSPLLPRPDHRDETPSVATGIVSLAFQLRFEIGSEAVTSRGWRRGECRKREGGGREGWGRLFPLFVLV